MTSISPQTEDITFQDQIEREVWIAASAERVWEFIACPGFWVGEGLRFDLKGQPGDTIEIPTEKWGTFPLEIVTLDPPRRAVYRWASSYPGEPLSDDTATTVEFTIVPRAGGVSVRVIERGFSNIRGTSDFRLEKYKGNVGGWASQMDLLKSTVETAS